MENRVTIAVSDGIADVRLNRPDKLNAVDSAMFHAVAEAAQTVSARKDVRAVVLSGEGRAFCAGLDLASMAGGLPADDIMERTHGIANVYQAIGWGWRECPVPVIAAIRGAAYGAGCQIALGTDIRIAASDAELSMMEMRWGIVPDCSGIATAQGLIRADVLRELVFTARKVPAAEAVALGLVTRLSDDPLAAAFDLARTIADANPHAIRAAKRMLNDALGQTSGEVLLAESREQKALLGSPNQMEAVAAGMMRRPPVFADPD